jgi:hypothetical protein
LFGPGGVVVPPAPFVFSWFRGSEKLNTILAFCAFDTRKCCKFTVTFSKLELVVRFYYIFFVGLRRFVVPPALFGPAASY